MAALEVSSEMLAFVTERHLATLTLARPNGRPHVTPVGFTFEPAAAVVRVITWNESVKARLLARGPLRAAVCQVDGGRWATFEGEASVSADPEECAEGVRRYAQRYSPPKDRGADRRVIHLRVDKVMGRA